MTSNRHNYFRWTPRTAKITIMYAVVVPFIVGYVGYKFDVSFSIPIPWASGMQKADKGVSQGRWDLRGKRKGDLLEE